MTIEEVRDQAEQLAKKYNPEGFSPFPFGNIQKDKRNLKILLTDKLPDTISGIIAFSQDELSCAILINKFKPLTRQYFTIAHELGHYFFHSDEIKNEPFVDADNVLDGTGMLYRREGVALTKLEMEANNFAASLIMPAELIKKAWEKLKSIEECAQVFHVSAEAMSIRLSRLKLVN